MRKSKNQLRKTRRVFADMNRDVVWKEIVNSVWHIAPVPPKFLKHPCSFPEEIPYRLINLYSDAGDVVLDPFCGSGQTTKVARYMKRKFLGVDIQGTYADYAAVRLREPPHIRAESITLEFQNNQSSMPRWKKLPTKMLRSGLARSRRALPDMAMIHEDLLSLCRLLRWQGAGFFNPDSVDPKLCLKTGSDMICQEITPNIHMVVV